MQTNERTQYDFVGLPIGALFARWLVSLAVGGLLLLTWAECGRAEVAEGAALFKERCAKCHGIDGQGVAGRYAEPLYGEYSVAGLASVIEATMPEDDPDHCVGEEARRVAEFIYHEFYSVEARRAKGLVAVPRVELCRLTVPQYRNAVADLVGSFTPEPRPPERGRGRDRDRDDSPPAPPMPLVIEPGLRGEYFQSKKMDKAQQLEAQRVDRCIDFDFGAESPAEGITADQFAVIWQGALVPDDTGEYQFRVRTENGARFYLNRDQIEHRRRLRDDSAVAGQSALIDAWVSDGELRERSASVFLLGGRRYPLRLEFFKYLEETASITLEWKPPHGTWSVLDHRHLVTARVPRVFVVDTHFPADDRSLGYERGRSVSHNWNVATADGAIAVAGEIVDRLPLLAGVDAGAGDRVETLGEFLARFACVGFRRPLTSEEDRFFRHDLLSTSVNPEASVRRAVIAVLVSPHFLYTDLTPVGQSPSQHAIASRLAFALWDSIPDATLLAAAGNGQLSTVEQIEDQARRMIADPRARFKMRGFFHHWLELDERDMTKDRDKFPEFSADVVADLRFSLEEFIDQVVWSDQSDYRQLLLADYLILNERLRSLYETQRDIGPMRKAASREGEAPAEPHSSRDAAARREPRPPVSDSLLADASPPDAADDSQPDAAADAGDADPHARSEADFDVVSFPPERRAGVLTHPYLLSAFAYHNNTSPIHRGVFLTRNIIGRPLKPPPVAVAFKDDEFAPDLTMREKITQLTRDSACMSCHSVINPLGFALENYDAVGRWRTSDNDRPVDSQSGYPTGSGETVAIRGARDIAEFAVASESAQRAFVTALFQSIVKQDPAAYGPHMIDQLRSQFERDAFHIRNLAVRMAVLSAVESTAILTARLRLEWPCSRLSREPT